MNNSNFDIDKLLEKGQIETELELEQSISAYKKLRILVRDNPSLKKKRKGLSNLIHEYESIHWSITTKIAKGKIKQSDEAEKIVEQEDAFISRRKEIIKIKLKSLKLNQQEFGKILGHNSKSYMSELMTGVRPFSLKDLIVISSLLKIDLNDLVFRSIPLEERRKIKSAIKKLGKPKLKLNTREFAFV